MADKAEPIVITTVMPNVVFPLWDGGQIRVEGLVPGESRSVEINGVQVIVKREHVH